MRKFKNGKIKALIITDALLVGIHFQKVRIVFNYDIPCKIENYMQRVSRAKTFDGRKGVAINFVLPLKEIFIEKIEKHYKIIIEDLPKDIPSLEIDQIIK
jgi:superfamily II DNA/RNA helicase